MSYPVGKVAALAGVTVRTLHHYDEIGLLSPNDRSGAGYRRYRDTDLERLAQILFYRELGFTLEEIAAVLDDPLADPFDHLRRQHALLTGRLERITEIVAAVEKAMEARKMGISLTPEERFEVFGEDDPQRYAEEAEARWGDTDAYRQSRRRTAAYTKDDWLTIKAEAAGISQALVDAMTRGDAADSVVAMDLAERHRAHITRWFYDCSYQIHRGLAEMYIADPRFTETYETLAPGLAGYIRDAIVANAERAGEPAGE